MTTQRDPEFLGPRALCYNSPLYETYLITIIILLSLVILLVILELLQLLRLGVAVQDI
jgi:hypothetical protein